jgi:hypothetical protein
MTPSSVATWMRPGRVRRAPEPRALRAVPPRLLATLGKEKNELVDSASWP